MARRDWLCLFSVIALAVSGSSLAAAFKDCEICPTLVVIPAGKHQMGDADFEQERPVHNVTFKRAFAIGQTEVTEAQFYFFIKRTGYPADAHWASPPVNPKRPAVGLGWEAAVAYTRWLSRYTGKAYRLPSEAEWDYAAHAGRPGRYWWGDSLDGACGNEHVYPNGLLKKPCEGADAEQILIDVGQLKANPWGLFDIMGNADEWTADCPPTDSKDYKGAPLDGSAWTGGEPNCISRRLKIGSLWGRERHYDELYSTHSFEEKLGFRVARDLP